MNLITRTGDRIKVDYDGEFCYEKCAVISDDVYLKDVWILELSTGNHRTGENFEMEFVKEIPFNHEPNRDEILRSMVTNGLNIYNDIAIVRHGYTIDREYD